MKISPARRVTLNTLFWFLVVNAVFTLILSYQYILNTVGIEGLTSTAFVHFALISNVGMLYLMIGVPLLAIFWFVSGKKMLSAILIPVILLFHVLTFVDVVIFRIFKFHINSMVINLFQTEGAWDSVHIGFINFLTFGGILAAVIALEILLLRWLYRHFDRVKYENPRRFPRRFPRPLHAALLLLILLMMILADKGMYAVADVANDYRITRHAKVFPLYQRFTMKRFLSGVFHVEIDRENAIKVDAAHSPLQYPKAPLTHDARPSYPNILWIVIDAWRFDMFSAEVTPRIAKFAQKSLVFDNHYSGGNASRFGVFSLFYGVYGYYWHQILGDRQSAVFIDELQKLGYDFRLISSTRLTYPEFRKTAFINIPDSIDDRLPGDSAEQKDPQLAQHFMDWLGARKRDKPFFSFLFFDAPHGPYSYTNDFEKFTPSQKTANYITVDKKDVLPLKNSYKNAIAFDDDLTGKILQYLEENRWLDNTIVLITADHGEEFYESGFFGHTSAFSKYQTKVPLILYLPGQAPQKITRLTSHLDVVPTMFSLLGYTTPPEMYAQGSSLLDAKERDFVVSCGWDDCAIIDNANSIVFSTETYNSYLFEVRDENYTLLPDYQAILGKKSANVMTVVKGFSQFNK